MSYMGYLEFWVERNSEWIVIKDMYYYGVFKVVRFIYMIFEFFFVYMFYIGGGYVSGDKYKMMIMVEKNV